MYQRSSLWYALQGGILSSQFDSVGRISRRTAQDHSEGRIQADCESVLLEFEGIAKMKSRRQRVRNSLHN